MKLNKNKNKLLLAPIILLMAALLVLPAITIKAQFDSSSDSFTTIDPDTIESMDNETVLELNKKISDKREEIEGLEANRDKYETKINQLLQDEKTLDNQLGFLENLMAKTELDIAVTEGKIKETIYKISQIKLELDDKKREVKEKKIYLESLLRLMYSYNEKSFLEILITNESFSSFLEELKYIEKIQNELGKILSHVESLKNQLIEKEEDLNNKKRDLKEQKNNLVDEQSALEDEEVLKTQLLDLTKSSERRYQGLYAELKQEQDRADSDIRALEGRLREKLAAQENSLSSLGEAVLRWPVDPSRGITSTFHDPDYPFRYIFEHPGIDIRAYQGTELKAAETGYVGRAKNGGLGYSYIMVLHSEGLSTVYGHVSRLDVTEGDYVTKGQVIGLSGGMPGTSGAGRLTTGPHLHFEIRLNGVPINPLNYLP